MPPIEIRTLHPDDAVELLAFETANRAWFETHVEARDASFYTPVGVRDHIDEYLKGYARGCWHPCIAVDESGRIVGRANLKDIDPAAGSAEVGYRIGQDQAGRGHATRLLQHLIAIAHGQWNLRSLVAEVTVKNSASAKVLTKCGFVRGSPRTRVAMVRGAWVDGVQYQLVLAQDNVQL